MPTVQDVVRKKGHAVYRIRPDATMQEAAQAFLNKDVSSLLVMDGDTVKGVFTQADLLQTFVDKPEDFQTTRVGDVTVTDYYSTTPDVALDQVFSEMVQRGTRYVPVFEGDRPIGMITSLDIVLEQKSSVRFEHEQLMQYIHGRHYE
jgi:CBS domain-containing protein